VAWVHRHPLLTLLCVTVLSVFGYATYKYFATSEGVATGPGVRGSGRAALVTLEAARLMEFRDEIEAIGNVKANESINVAAQVTDTISAVNFEDGQFVEAGTVLVELTNEEETALLAEARANFEDASKQHERFRDLVGQGSASEQQMDEARTRQMAARARLEAIEARLDDRLVRAPFAGLLGFREISQGTLVTPGTLITTLDDISFVKLDFSVPERFFSVLEPGLEVVAVGTAWENREFKGTVTAVGARIDQDTRAVTVRARIQNSDLALRPGMLLTIRLVHSRESVLFVSEAAIVQRQLQSYVFTVDEGLARQIEVTIGRRRPGIVEILSGLEPGQSVVTLGVDRLRPGMSVRVQAEGTADQRPQGGKPRGNRTVGNQDG
jgi:membrane fusion protein (multidrug efflux system)